MPVDVYKNKHVCIRNVHKKGGAKRGGLKEREM